MAAETIGWEEASTILTNFTLFVDEPEMRWFKKTWEGFIKAGKASYSNDIEKHWVLARIVTLGVMFNEFAEKAWNEGYRDEGIYELAGGDYGFDPVRLGSMVDPKLLSEEADEAQLFYEAVADLVGRSRLDVFDTVEKIFGNRATVFVSLWLCLDEDIEVGCYSEELYEDALNWEETPEKTEAFSYVTDGMSAIDS